VSEQGHKYTFAGFDGPYWEKKAEREAAMTELSNAWCYWCEYPNHYPTICVPMLNDRRNDKEFRERLDRILAEQKVVLDRLAES